jgi:murein DD-endopeptidase MepM/ murein hydrolase activator NlpD
MRRERGISLLVLAALPLLASCGTADRSAPVYEYGQRGGAGSAGYHTVASGETLYRLSQRYGLAMPDIIAANNLQPPYALASGQRLKLPPPRVYHVKPGDTLYNVAHAFGVSESEIARQNDLKAPYRLASGAQLRLPSALNEIQPAASSSFYLPPPAPGKEMPPPHLAPAGRVEREVLASARPAAPVSSRAEAQPQQVQYQWNYGLPPYDEASSARSVGAPRAGAMPQPPAAPAAYATASSFTPPVPAVSAQAGFIWPVEGRIISSFGGSEGGIHNDGIDIAAARGAPVRAARGGTVVYAGRHLRGYGNLVLVRHEDGWVTAYAHMQKILVSKGAQIAQGDAIGTVGSTGSVESEQLHFEIRRGTEALDPMKYLNRRAI